jgi:hypothetical protein
MKRWIIPLCLLLAALLVSAPERAAKAEDKDTDGFKPLFNGKDLSGWVKVNNAPGTFYVKDKEIITTGVPTGYLRTDKMYENFIAEFEWMHVPPNPKAVGNSGFFVWCDPLPALGTGYSRAIEVQVLVNLERKDYYTSQGDLFSIHGATCVPDRPHPQGWARCLPSENRCKGANEWNHYRVEAKDGVLKLAVNGKIVSGVSKCKPRKGYLALEAEGSECHFRNLKIKELPTSNPKPDEVCDEAKDFVTLFSGLNLDGWKASEEGRKHWKANPGANSLVYDGKATNAENLTTEKEYGDCEVQFDCRLPAKGEGTLLIRGSDKAKVDLAKAPAGRWNRFTVTLKGDQLTTRVNGKVVEESSVAGIPSKGAIVLAPKTRVEFMSLFVRELK